MDNGHEAHKHNGIELIGRENETFWKTKGFPYFLKYNSDTAFLIDAFSLQCYENLMTFSPGMYDSTQEIHPSKLG